MTMQDTAFTHTISIPFQDIDAAGILFFGRLFDHAHMAYERFMDLNGHSLSNILKQKEYLLPLVHAEADYRIPISHNETITIELYVKKVGNSSFSLHYSFTDESGTLRATAETVHVVLDTQTKKPTSISENLRTTLQSHLRS